MPNAAEVSILASMHVRMIYFFAGGRASLPWASGKRALWAKEARVREDWTVVDMIVAVA